MMLTHLDAVGQRRLADFLDCGNRLLDELNGAIEASQNHLSKALEVLKPYLPPGIAYTGKACEAAGTKVNRSDSLIAQAAIKSARRPSIRRPSSTSPPQRAARCGAIKR